ncbi:MAG: beta-glucoside-specific PTS transporter subunit IIABC [Pseudoclavibacter sp.]
MNDKERAEAILQHVGGADNVQSLQHCSTRLRFTLNDTSKAGFDELRAVPGVLGAVDGPQTQVIVGNRVVEVYAAVKKLIGSKASGTTEGGGERVKQPLTWKRAGSVTMDFIVSVFTPIVPAIAGAGILKSILILLAAIGWISKEAQTYLVLATIADAVFAFLPLLVAYTTATKLQVNRPVAIGAVSVLVFPGFTNLVTQEGGIALFGIPVPAVNYTSQVFPAILTVLLLWGVERLFNRITPGPIRVFFVPLMCFFIVVPISMLALGPLGFGLGSLLTTAIIGLHQTFGWVAVALLAATLPFIIAVGMHKALLPPTIAAVADTGSESLYLPASLAHNLAESGATFGVALRTKNQGLRATSLSAGIAALFGITEPALYGVTLQNRRALIAVIIGALSAGTYMGLTHVSGLVAVGPGLASISMFVNPDNPMNIVNALIGVVIAFVVSFVVSLILWRDAASATLRVTGAVADPNAEPDAQTGRVELRSPLAGDVIPLTEVNDAVFSAEILGKGIAVRPTDGKLVAPISGTVTSMLDTKHAIGITSPDGVEVLVHVGLDTVKLNGEHFTALIEQGDEVEAGQALLEVDLDAITAAGYDTTTPIVILNSNKFDIIADQATTVSAGQKLATIEAKELAHGTA